MPYKRAGSPNWQITVSGVRQSAGTSDYQRAKTLEHKLNHEAWDAKKLGLKFRTWDQSCLDWFKRKASLKSVGVYASYAKFWKEHLSGRQLRSITPEFVRSLLIAGGHVNVDVAVPANSTANNKLAFVGKIVRNAGIVFEAQYFPAPEGREEWLTVAQWHSIVMTNDLRHVATFSLATGLRQANVIGLPWEWVKGDYLLVPSASAKTRKPYGIPLNKTALAVIQERRASPVVHARSVFTMEGREIYRVQLGRAWNAALRDSGVPHITYHGLRHTFASWMVQAGVPFEVVQRLGQWKPRGMVHRYAHFDVESLRPWAERMDTILARGSEKFLQNKAV